MSDNQILNNRYHLQSVLGSGGMAVVYRAQDSLLERTVAIKVLRKTFSGDPAFRERFRQEAKAAASLSHPNIVTVHDFGLDADQLFIVMENVPGTDLKSIMQKRGSLTIAESMALILQACAGIGFAHRTGLIHCDVKPQNILVTQDWRVKVVDFGIARALTSIQPDERHEIVWGSPQYYSPEQAAGEPPSPASDVYSLGVVLFEMLTGKLPFSATSSEELGRMHRETLAPSPRRLNPNIPPQLEEIVLSALAKQPAARFSTAEEFGNVLSSFNSLSPDALPAFINPATAQVETLYFSLDQPAQAAQPPVSYTPVVNAARGASSTPPVPGSIGIDWITWLLALITIIFAGGLIPFWLWVFYQLNPPF
jgi:eukaryotic-like serine/threonine-protein kinase